MSGTSQNYGRYSLLKRLARGGMAEIFEARVAGPAGFDKRVAVKRLHANLAEDQLFVSMLGDEARITARLSHPNICQVFDFGIEADTYFIAMELIEGCDLGNLARRARKMSLDLTLPACAFIAREAAEGLAYAHALCDEDGRPLDVVHRDVSPQNILVSAHGEVKVCDFGIAKATARLANTQAGVLKGKFCYMAPEQARGEPLDGRADVFALGIVLYELIAGAPLYPQTFSRETLDIVRRGAYPPLRAACPHLTEGFEQVLQRALAVSRVARPTARELSDLLGELIRQEGWQFDRSSLAAVIRTVLPELAREPTGEDAGETQLWAGSDRLGPVTDERLGTDDLEIASGATMAATPANLREPAPRPAPVRISSHGRTAPPARTPASGSARAPAPAAGLAGRGGGHRRSVLDPRHRGELSGPTEALPGLPPEGLAPAAPMTTRMVADDVPTQAPAPASRPARAGPWLTLGVLVAGAVTGVAFAVNAPFILGGSTTQGSAVAPPAPAPFVPFAVFDAGAGVPESDAGGGDDKAAPGGRRGRGPRPRGAGGNPPQPADTGRRPVDVASPDTPTVPSSGGVALTIAALPTGVASVDGRRVGRTPVTVRLPAGRHNVVVERADGRRALRTVYLSNEPQRLFVNLE